MKTKNSTLAFAALCSAALFFIVSCSLNPSADRIFTDGHIITMDEKSPVVQAFAVSGENIISTGTSDEMRSNYPDAVEVHLQGRTVMPGIIEAHGHMISLGRSIMELNVEGVENPEDAVQKVKERAAETPAGEWIVGWGWDEGAWAGNYPTNEELNKVSPDNPVWLRGLHGFAGWANAKALEIADITKDTPNPRNGEILKNPVTGIPTGILTNEAQGLLTRHIAPLSLDQVEKVLELAAEECLKNGLTTVHEFGISAIELEALRSLAAEERLQIRIYGILSFNESLIEPFLRNGPEIDLDNRLTIGGIKVFIDGALGSRGAALFEPYSDAQETRGLLTFSPDELRILTTNALNAGMQVSTHAIGDRGNRVALDAYEAALKDVTGVKNHRLRIEHAQVVALEDIPRFAELGIIASMQPPHATSDMSWAEERVGPERIKGAYAWRSFMDAGVHVPLSSDFPGETLNPFWGMYAAETRQSPEGEPAGGWYPEQNLTRQQVLRAYTYEAAYAGFEEGVKGKIAPGMLADFIVLSDDILTISSQELLTLKVEQTYVGGDLVFDLRGTGRNE